MSAAVADLARSYLPGNGTRELTFDEHDAVEDVLDAAQAWQGGTLPLGAALGTGWLEAWNDRGELAVSPGYSRFTASVVTTHDDPRYPALIALIDAAIDRQGYVRTRHGSMRSHALRAPMNVRRGVF